MPLLQVRGLEKWYGRRQVVSGVDYDVERGEVVGLLGPNGAGKTTSFRMTIGLIDADGGSVMFDDRDVTKLPMYLRARAGMGYLAQDSSVFRQLSVEDNLMAILETRTQHDPEAAKRPAERAARPVRPDQDPQDQGQPRLRRRAPAARDRPVADHRAQDDHARRAVRRHRPQDRRRDPGPDPRPGRADTTSASCLTDHQFRETLEVTDRCYVIREGRVFAYGNREQILNNPDVRRHYIGERFDVGHLLDRRGPRALPPLSGEPIGAEPKAEDDDEPPDHLGQIVTTT